MKKRFLAAFLLISCASFSQPVIKLYGFVQFATVGTAIERDLSNPAASKPKASTIYYFYISGSHSVSVKPVELWVGGQRYSINAAPMVATPINTSRNEVMVAKTTSKVQELKWDMKPLPAQKKIPSWLNKMIQENELIVAYLWKGKKYYKTLKKIKTLESISGV